MFSKIKTWLKATATAVVVAVSGWFGLQATEAQTPADTLTWSAPTQRVDGTALPASEIAAYEVEWGTSTAGPFPNTFQVPGTATSYTVADRALDGRRCYRMMTVDTLAQVSDPSNVACTEKCPSGYKIQADGSCAKPGRPNKPGTLNAN